MEEHFTNKLITEIEQQYPAFLRPKDLVKLGLYTSTTAVSIALAKGKAPPHIKITRRKLTFPRACLCEWLQRKSEKL